MHSTKTLLTALAACSLIGAAQAATVDLTVVNGDFETDANTTPGATGWTVAPDHFWTSDGSIGGGLDPDNGADGTAKFLSPNRLVGNAGSNPTSSFASQNVDVSAFASDIDGGSVTLDVEFWYSNGKNTDERTLVTVEFFDGAAGSLGLTSTNELPQSATEGGWTQYSAIDAGDYLNPENGDLIGLAVPTGARSFSITLNQRRLGGSATNAGIDEVSAALNGVVPEPGSLALLGLGGLLIARRRRG